jgi:hypothetical protein
MKHQLLVKRFLVMLFTLAVLAAVVKLLSSHCPEHSRWIDIKSAPFIKELYPWPDAKIPFACQTVTFLKSPFAPRMMDYDKDVLKEDGLAILPMQDREGAVVITVSRTGGLYRQFPESVRLGTMPTFADAVSLYVDGKKLEIGHISYREFADEFTFVTILNPFLWPGKHIGKIVILLPTGGTKEYEWHFEITWW